MLEHGKDVGRASLGLLGGRSLAPGPCLPAGLQHHRWGWVLSLAPQRLPAMDNRRTFPGEPGPRVLLLSGSGGDVSLGAIRLAPASCWVPSCQCCKHRATCFSRRLGSQSRFQMDCLGNQGLTASGQFTSMQSVSTPGVGGGTRSTELCFLSLSSEAHARPLRFVE